MNEPHLSPGELFDKGELAGHWGEAEIAIICFTPFPSGFEIYVIEVSKKRYFLHSPQSEVRLCRFGNTFFIVISEVYGFAVGVTTVEELAHYGFKYIIGLGYIGAFNQAKVGSPFIAKGTMSDLPIATHYGVKEYDVSLPTESFQNFMLSEIELDEEKWGCYMVWNSNSLYREYNNTVDKMREKGCQVVNMDTLSIFSAVHVCRKEMDYPIECVYIGSVTDSAVDDKGAWDSDLKDSVNGVSKVSHNRLVKYLVERILEKL